MLYPFLLNPQNKLGYGQFTGIKAELFQYCNNKVTIKCSKAEHFEIDLRFIPSFIVATKSLETFSICFFSSQKINKRLLRKSQRPESPKTNT